MYIVVTHDVWGVAKRMGMKFLLPKEDFLTVNSTTYLPPSICQPAKAKQNRSTFSSSQPQTNLHLKLNQVHCPRRLYHQPRMSDAWFKEQIAPDGVAEDGCHTDEAHALQSYLNNKTTAQDAAHAITQTVLSTDDPGENLYRLWGLLQNALVELSATHIPTLINLLQAIQELPDPDQTALSKGGFTWKGLSKFGHLWGDIYKQDNWRNDLSITLSSFPTISDKLKKRQELRATHIRTANIEARLAVANIGGIPLDWGYDAIADALEVDTAVLDFEIPAAREWIEVAGKELHQGAKEGRESWALSRKRDMGREDGRMSLIRWEFWEGMIREFQERGEVVWNAGKAAGEEMRKLREPRK